VIGANGDRFHAVKFAADAQKEIDEWKDETETEAERLQIEDEAFSSFLYKLPKKLFRCRLIFHVLKMSINLFSRMKLQRPLRSERSHTLRF
jgi:hypothetical protein